MRVVLATAIALGLAATFAVAAPVGALPVLSASSELYPVADRYEPGETATLVGYTGPGSAGWIEDGPFYAFLSPSGDGGAEVELGQLTLAETGHEGWRALRVSVTFPVPDDLVAGTYRVRTCNDPCALTLGDLVGGTVAVGVDPDDAFVRVWSLDEPEIANVADGAVIAGPGYEASAAVIRAGDLLRPPPAPVPARSLVDPVPAPPAPPVTYAVAPPVELPSASPSGSTASVNGAWLVFGGLFAAACVLSVLVALRQSDPAGRMATP